MSKQDQFVDWLTGRSKVFPFFKNMPEVRRPEIYRSRPDIEDETEEEGLARIERKMASDMEDAKDAWRERDTSNW